MGKKAIIGLKGAVLSKVTTDTLTAYASEAASIDLPFAGGMTRSPKETSQDVFYDDALYATIKDVLGEDVELRLGEVPVDAIVALGVGTYDEQTGKVEANFTPDGGAYSLRCVTDTVGKRPFYFNWRVFDLTGFRFDNFATKGSSATVCEVIITGTFKSPRMPTVKDYAYIILKDDESNKTACEAFLKDAETYPPVGG